MNKPNCLKGLFRIQSRSFSYTRKGLRKDKTCCPVFVFSKTYTSTNAIYDLVLYLLREGLEMSLMIYEDLQRFRTVKF